MIIVGHNKRPEMQQLKSQFTKEKTKTESQYGSDTWSHMNTMVSFLCWDKCTVFILFCLHLSLQQIGRLANIWANKKPLRILWLHVSGHCESFSMLSKQRKKIHWCHKCRNLVKYAIKADSKLHCGNSPNVLVHQGESLNDESEVSS